MAKQANQPTGPSILPADATPAVAEMVARVVLAQLAQRSELARRAVTGVKFTLAVATLQQMEADLATLDRCLDILAPPPSSD